MREIKFRAWINNEYMAIQGTPDLETLQSFMFHYGNKELMQYTGIKNHTGKEIYQRDIVKGNHKDNFFIEKINGGLQMVNIKYYGQKNNELIAMPTCDPQTKSWLMNAEIIGNIYENPELIKPQIK